MHQSLSEDVFLGFKVVGDIGVHSYRRRHLVMSTFHVTIKIFNFISYHPAVGFFLM